jgi:hypothetical protein
MQKFANIPAVSPQKWMPLLSWITGWVNCAGWVALTATGGLLGSQLVVGVIALMNPVCLYPEFYQRDAI